MNKIGLVIKREYLTRVRNRTFILTTILTPLVFVIFIGGTTFISMHEKENQKIAVLDFNGFFVHNLKNSSDITYEFPKNVDSANYLQKGYTAILLIPKFNNSYKTNDIVRSQKSIGIDAKGEIEDNINKAIEDKMLQDAGIKRSELDSIRINSQFATLKYEQQNGSNVKESSQELAYGIGFASGFLIYITMFIYGAMLMRGVMEEKTSRIAEVIISSIKPFQLMMGKIIGIGAVGITQFFIWIILIIGLSAVAQSFVPHDVMQQVQALQQNNGALGNPGMNAHISEAAQNIYTVQHTLSTANWTLIIVLFIFYFIGGYLFYGALFAAIGSVVEDQQNSQSLMVPITLPIIFSFFVMTMVVQNPDTNLAVWCSIIPFSSPMVMMARIAYGVPGTVSYIQLISSVLVLIAGFLFTTWLAGKVYRTGILLYGKKITWKEMFKWALRKS